MTVAYLYFVDHDPIQIGKRTNKRDIYNYIFNWLKVKFRGQKGPHCHKFRKVGSTAHTEASHQKNVIHNVPSPVP